MAARKPFLLRIDPAVLDAVQKWAGDDLRSVNAQIEYVLREALARAGRMPRRGDAPAGQGRREVAARKMIPGADAAPRTRIAAGRRARLVYFAATAAFASAASLPAVGAAALSIRMP